MNVTKSCRLILFCLQKLFFKPTHLLVTLNKIFFIIQNYSVLKYCYIFTKLFTLFHEINEKSYHYDKRIRMDPSEVEFLGEKQLVSIVPNFSFGIIHLISGSIGPFKAGMPVKVPIWLALGLKQQQKCRIIPLEWMNSDTLAELYEAEKSSKVFTRMPSDHFMDEAQLLLTAAPDDIPDADNIRTAIKDLWDLRMSKLRSSVINFVKTSGSHAALNHLTAMEINSVRSLFPDALDVMHHMKSMTRSTQQSQPSQGFDTTL